MKILVLTASYELFGSVNCSGIRPISKNWTKVNGSKLTDLCCFVIVLHMTISLSV